MFLNETDTWNKAYQRRDNFVFYPHEEVIRFVSKYIAKRVGFDEFQIKHKLGNCSPKVLDLGCGLGRHVKFIDEYKLEGYGIDLSADAIEMGREILKKQALAHLADRIIPGDATNMPYEDCFFDFAISHGTFDSMPFEKALKSIKELHRCMKSNGYAYIDVISGNDSRHAPEYCGEEVVDTEHEKGTIQSYFNWGKILSLCEGLFEIEEGRLIKNHSQLTADIYSRYHLVLKKH